MFTEVFEYFERRGFSWNNESVCTTEDASATLCNRTEFWESGKQSILILRIFTMIYRYPLGSKRLQSELKATLDGEINMVNFIKSSALNNRLFRLSCQEFDDEQNTLLFHTEVGWLSRGNMLSRVYS